MKQKGGIYVTSENLNFKVKKLEIDIMCKCDHNGGHR